MIRSITAIVLLNIAFLCNAQTEFINLAGKWNLCLDSVHNPANVDLKTLDYNLAIALPSTLDSAGIGNPVHVQPVLVREVMLHLQRKVSYIGPAYYQKEVTIPQNWNGKHISLKLERVLWESTVWIDGKKIGNSYSLCTPHYYDLSANLLPGKHIITICIDNSRKFVLNNADMAHAYTQETQVKWNGILGEISLSAVDPNFISAVAVYPDFAGKSLKAEVNTVFKTQGAYSIKVEVLDKNNKIAGSNISAAGKDKTAIVVKLPGALQPWDEFNPNLYTVKVSLLDRKQKIKAVRFQTVGFRDLKASDRHFYLNGKPLFLRGTLECSIFPLTGHPPLNEEGWRKVFEAARSYGLNHLRFHSWCPPDAAFRVADQMGMYIQVELPNWSLTFGADQPMVNFINLEADNIIREYGNHPSFILWSMGNELEGNFDLLTGLVTRLRNKDPRHLYTTTTYSFQKEHGTQPESVDDFYITQNTEKGWVRGQGVFDQLSPDFKTDYTHSIDHLSIPVVSHEIGQYSVYPDMKEIEKYKGVLSPVNFIAVQKDLERKGLLSKAGDYTAATGKFATLLYKEEIERALKTSGLSGFQLLDLHDFPGQGTALVGVLNAFWESKGFVSAEEWRMFCSEVVPLLWFEKAVYTTNETFKAEYGIADYFKDYKNAVLKWRVIGSDGKIIREDSARFSQVLKGNTSKLGSFSIPLADMPAPAKYTIQLMLQGTGYKNQWNFWLYQPEVKSQDDEIVVTTSFKDALAALDEGKKVLLNPDVNNISGITGKFVPVFWSPVHFPDQPGTMGLLMDPNHAAFRDFPTDFYSNWQWWDLCKNSKTVILDKLAVDPIVTVIDNFFKNRKLGNVFEARVGKGLLVFSSVDLHTDLEKRPVARQLRSSLINYMKSSDFKPASSITGNEVLTLSAEAK